MSNENKAVLEQANAAVAVGDNEGFLSFCTEDIEWRMVGDKTIQGKEAVRQWMKTEYAKPPQFTLSDLIAEGDFVTALGTITLKDDDGKTAEYAYCDVWRFRGGKMAELRAFVIKSEPQPRLMT